MVVEDFGARPAGAGVRHLPEVVAAVLGSQVVADAHAAGGRDADVRRPDVVGLVIVDVDSGPQLVGRQAVDLGQELPREADRVALEIVAEAEIAQHLEERVMAGGVADILQVVVLAAGAHAALGSGGAGVGAPLHAREHVLELDHAGVHKQQGRVVAGHERGRRHDGVPALGEIAQELGADIGGFHGDRVLVGVGSRKAPRRRIARGDAEQTFAFYAASGIRGTYAKALVGDGLLNPETQKFRLDSIVPRNRDNPTAAAYRIGIARFGPWLIVHDGQIPGSEAGVCENVYLRLEGRVG